jgi:ribosomal-protein-alanine N-acetyltransferase
MPSSVPPFVLPSWTLRAGLEGDITSMYLLDLKCFDEPFRFDMRAMRRFVMYRGAIVILAEAAGELVGFVVVHVIRRSNRKFGYVVTLDVASDYRRQGLARALVSGAETRAAEAGASMMILHVFERNAAAVALYERQGYRRQEFCPSFYGQDLDAWVHGKSLGEVESAGV